MMWQEVPEPCVCLAPMADVTDAAFRQMFAKYGKPDVTWNEFVSADGLFLRPVPDEVRAPRDRFEEIIVEHGIDPDHPLAQDLRFSDNERPVVAQFFSKQPELMKKAAKLAVDLGYDGVDINMGCPDKNVCKQGGGAAMIKTPEQAVAVIRATMEGAGEVPVSVKTRVGWSRDEELLDWARVILETKPAVLTFHARTKKDMSKVPARWELLPAVVELRNKVSPDTKIFGNGDISSRADALRKIKAAGVEGAMVGRGVFGNPWFFNQEVVKSEVSFQSVAKALDEHIQLFTELEPHKSWYLMKKHFKSYLSGFNDDDLVRTKQVKVALMEAADAESARAILATYL